MGDAPLPRRGVGARAHAEHARPARLGLPPRIRARADRCRGAGSAPDVPQAIVRMRAISRRDLPSPRRSIRMVQRNLLVYRHGWMIVFSGFFEPVFYLLGLGFGLGAIVPQVQGIDYVA